MLEGYYYNVIKNISRNQVVKEPNIPDTTLGIFDTETKVSIPVLILRDYTPPEIIKDPIIPTEKMTPTERIQPDLQEIKYSNEDFGNVFYLGSGGDV